MTSTHLRKTCTRAIPEGIRPRARRRFSEWLDRVTHGFDGSSDTLLMVADDGDGTGLGHAALAVGNSTPVLDAVDTSLKVYRYSRAKSIVGGTVQIQKNIIATGILGLPTA